MNDEEATSVDCPLCKKPIQLLEDHGHSIEYWCEPCYKHWFIEVPNRGVVGGIDRGPRLETMKGIERHQEITGVCLDIAEVISKAKEEERMHLEHFKVCVINCIYKAEQNMRTEATNLVYGDWDTEGKESPIEINIDVDGDKITKLEVKE